MTESIIYLKTIHNIHYATFNIQGNTEWEYIKIKPKNALSRAFSFWSKMVKRLGFLMQFYPEKHLLL